MRMAKKNVEEAAVAIMARREQLEQQARDRRRQRRQVCRIDWFDFIFFLMWCCFQDRLGKTANGNPVDLEMLDEMVEMGFEAKLVAQALRQVCFICLFFSFLILTSFKTNNDLAAATELLTTQPDLLKTSADGIRLSRAALTQLENMGFSDRSRNKRALQACGGNVEEAASMLLAQGDAMEIDQAQVLKHEQKKEWKLFC